MMEIIEEQRVCLKFCYKLGKTATETYDMLSQVFEEDALSRTTCFQWFKRFKEGRTSIKDDVRSGRPSTSKTDEKVVKIRELILANKGLTVRELADEVGISYGSCQDILSNILGMIRVSMKFVPRLLTHDQKEDRVEISNELLERAENDPNFLFNIIAGDECLIYGYDVETNSQSSQPEIQSSPKPKKMRLVKSDVQAILVIFFDSHGIVYHEWVPTGRAVNQSYYFEVLKRLLESIKTKRPESWKGGYWKLHHDNAPFRSSLLVRQYLAKNTVTVIPHPPYSPDLAPCDFFLFPKLTGSLKGRRLQTIEEIKANAESFLLDIPNGLFKECFEKLKLRWQGCIAAAGDYFDGDDFDVK